MRHPVPGPYRLAQVALLLLIGDFVSRPFLGYYRWRDTVQLLSGTLIVGGGVAIGWPRRPATVRDQAERHLAGVVLSVMGLLIALGALLFNLSRR